MAKKKQLKVAPLSSSFMLTAMVGILISGVYVYPKDPTWGFTFLVFFVLMFIASIISMTYAPVEPQLRIK